MLAQVRTEVAAVCTGRHEERAGLRERPSIVNTQNVLVAYRSDESWLLVNLVGFMVVDLDRDLHPELVVDPGKDVAVRSRVNEFGGLKLGELLQYLSDIPRQAVEIKTHGCLAQTLECQVIGFTEVLSGRSAGLQ